MKNPRKNLNLNFPLKSGGVLFILLMLIIRMNLSAQPALTVYADASKSVISAETAVRTAFLGTYNYRNYQIEAALRTDLPNGNNAIMSGYLINGSREFKIRNFKFTLNGFWLWTAPSHILKVTDWGSFISIYREHFEMKIGTSFKTYSFRKKAIEDFKIDNDATKIHENFNMLYAFTYNLRPSHSRWNAGLTLSNADYFLINQETNPNINVHFSCKVSSPVCLFTEGWYKTAGLLNMHPEYFGYTIKIGLIWKIK